MHPLPNYIFELTLLTLIFSIPSVSMAETNTDALPIVIPASSLSVGTDLFTQLSGEAHVPLEKLASLRGGTEIVNNEQKFNGVVSQNSAENLTSGANTISNGAFANASGIPIVIQNSGANVLIQNATVINLQIK